MKEQVSCGGACHGLVRGECQGVELAEHARGLVLACSTYCVLLEKFEMLIERVIGIENARIGRGIAMKHEATLRFMRTDCYNIRSQIVEACLFLFCLSMVMQGGRC